MIYRVVLWLFYRNLFVKLKLPLAFCITMVVLLPGMTYAQLTEVKGKIIDANSGDPLPFVNVVFKGTLFGTTTDFEGNYTLTSNTPSDTLYVSYIGYLPKYKLVKRGIKQTINFQLEENVQNLQEVVVLAGENPAFAVLRNVIANKDINDKKKLSAYEYDTYSKIEIDIDNISEKFREKKIMKKITQVMDSVERIAGDDGKPILPIFISETISKIYYRANPQLKTERISNTKISGVGVDDGTTFITQIVGSSFQEYNFYQNWLNILSKDFISPIADGWKIYYEYDLTDSLYIGDDYCYRLDFFPKSPQDLAFTGVMWITKNEYALKQIDVTVPKTANLNFIEKIKIQQELGPTTAGAWIPIKNRVLIDVGEVNDKMGGLLTKFYTSNQNVVVNEPKDNKFYERPVVLAEDTKAKQNDNDFWDNIRHEPLSETEKSVIQMIDTLQNIPVIRTYTDIIKIFVNGYYNVGKIELGPYNTILAFNDIEGLRAQMGFRTTSDLSRNWVFGGQLAYGFNDEKFKYTGSITNIISREKWTTLTLKHRYDLGRIGIDEEALSANYFFLAAQRFGVIRRGNYYHDTRLDFRREFFKGFTQRVVLRYNTFDPAFSFGYYEKPNDLTAPILDQFQTAEIILETRYARDELFIQTDNDRISLGATRWPIISFQYTRGIKGIMDSDFNYDKLGLSFQKKMKMSFLGTSSITLAGEYTFDPLPYPLLSLHLGNQTFVYTSATYNLMNYGEFVSDRFATLKWQHHFEGFFLNRIPLLKKLKWRLLATSNVLVGGMTQTNRALVAETSPLGEPTIPIGYFTSSKPYVEVGYGVENIFKFLRVDFIHRLTYKQAPESSRIITPIRNFGIFISGQIVL